MKEQTRFNWELAYLQSIPRQRLQICDLQGIMLSGEPDLLVAMGVLASNSLWLQPEACIGVESESEKWGTPLG